MAEGGWTMTFEMRKCQVKIENNVANVIMVSAVDCGKVTSLTMRIDEFMIYENIRRNKIQQGE